MSIQRSIFSIAGLLFALLNSGCVAETEEPEAVAAVEEGITTDSTDATGTIHIHVSTCTDIQGVGTHNTDCTVPVGYVLVGGGAEVRNAAPNGALLTASFPDTDLKTWHASSKDMDFLQTEQLASFAIGMRIDGISEATLRSKMTIVHADSAVNEHPTGSVALPAGYLLVGGGTAAHWSTQGLYLTQTYGNASSNTWSGAAKDHGHIENGYVTTYAIGVSTSLTKVCGGTSRTLFHFNSFSSPSFVATGYSTSSMSVPSGHALTSVGGLASYNGPGRILTAITPWNSAAQSQMGALATSKDHEYTDSGNTQAYAASVQWSGNPASCP
jgi:hypothetical protein